MDHNTVFIVNNQYGGLGTNYLFFSEDLIFLDFEFESYKVLISALTSLQIFPSYIFKFICQDFW